jgi:hypothetical protein
MYVTPEELYSLLVFSTASWKKAVVNAYSLSVQGFFVKQNSIVQLEKPITAIMEDWKRCIAPKHFSHYKQAFLTPLSEGKRDVRTAKRCFPKQ